MLLRISILPQRRQHSLEKEKQKAINELINKINKEQNLNIQLILNDKEVFDKFKEIIGVSDEKKN